MIYLYRSIPAILAAAALLFFALAACAPHDAKGASEAQPDYGTIQEITTHAGTRCVVYGAGYGGGISCDWSKTK